MRRKIISILAVLSVVLLATFVGIETKAADKNRELSEHLQRGVALYEAGNYADAYFELTVAENMAANDKFSRHKIDFYKAMSLSWLDNDMDALELYLERYPRSTYGNQVKLRLATMLFEQQRYGEARQCYEQVRITRIKTDMDEYYFNMGYCAFEEGEYDKARAYFNNVNTAGEYGAAVTYYFGYMDYLNKQYATAKEYFQALSNDLVYKDVVPFYLLQIEFVEGNYDYVIEHYADVMSVAVGDRLLEVVRMVSEAWFNKEAWENVCDFMSRYEQMGGKLGREENYMAGYAYYILEDYEQAEHYLVRACGPDDALSQNASYHLGDCYLRLGNTEQAMRSFSIASNSGYDDKIREDALFNYGKMQYASGGGYFDETINVLSRYLTQYPNSPRRAEVEEYLIAAYYNSKNYDAAYSAIKRFPNPDNNMKSALQKIAYFRGLESFNRGEFNDARNYLNESLQYKFSAKYTALTTFWLAEIAYRQKKYLDAVRGYEEYVRISPATEREHYYAYYNAAYAYYNNNNLSSAKNWFDRFVKSYRTSDVFKADAYNRLGDIAASGRSFWQAIEYYDGAIKVGTDDKYYATYRRAIMLGLVDRVPRKIETLNNIISAGEGEYVPTAMYELGRTYMVQEQFAQAAGVLERFVGLYPSSAEYNNALSDLGLIYRNLNNNDKALKYYQMIVQNPYSSSAAKTAMNEIRSIYVDENKVDAYFDYANKMGYETDASVVMRDSLEFTAAQRIYINGDKQRAAEALDKYIANYPNGGYVAAAYYYASDCAISVGNATVAIEKLEKLAALPMNDYTERALEGLIDHGRSLKRYDVVADAANRLSSVARSTDVRKRALTDWLEAVVAEGDNEKIVSVADEVAGRSDANATIVRKAQFVKAKALSASDREVIAQEIYAQLSKEVASAEGAESAYRVIEHSYKVGNTTQAEELVYSFADKNTPHAYWLGKAFLVLGDIYNDKGDAFQARATYQSIVDGYSVADDGIIEEAKARIQNLK